jgi:hypothetical protein
MESDKELELLKIRKLHELRKRLTVKRPKEPTDRDLLVSKLVDRGVEVLEAAEASYPKETAAIVKRLVDLINEEKFKEFISGGQLLWLFRRLGMRIHIETTINIAEHGKIIPLAEKLKTKET